MKPWEKYGGATPTEGPWSKYQQPAEDPNAARKEISAFMQSDQMGANLPDYTMGQKAYDFVRSIPAGAARGYAAAGGIFGDLGVLGMPTTANIEDAYERRLTGEWYDPKTSAGKYGSAVGSALMYAPLAGAGVAQQAVNSVTPALVSEAAGQATEGSDLEPWARVGGALLGVGAASKLQKVPTQVQNTVARVTAPSLDDVVAQRDAAYRAIGGTHNPDDLTAVADDITRYLNAEGFDAPQAQGILNKIRSRTSMSAQTGQSMTPKEVDGLRKAAGRLVSSLEPQERAAGAIVADRLDDFLGNQGFGKARELAQRVIQERKVSEMSEAANAGGYLSGADSGLRNQAANVLRSASKRRQLTPQMREAYEKISGGHQVLQSIGRAGGIDPFPGGKGPGAIPVIAQTAAAVGSGGATLPAQAAIQAGTSSAAILSRLLTQLNVERARRTALAGRDAIKSLPRMSREELIKQLLLQSQAATAPSRAEDE